MEAIYIETGPIDFHLSYKQFTGMLRMMKSQKHGQVEKGKKVGIGWLRVEKSDQISISDSAQLHLAEWIQLYLN